MIKLTPFLEDQNEIVDMIVSENRLDYLRELTPSSRKVKSITLTSKTVSLDRKIISPIKGSFAYILEPAQKCHSIVNVLY